MYGLDSFVAPPPLAAIASLVLVAGCDGVGVVVLRAFGLCRQGAPRWHRWQAGVVGAMSLAIVLYPLALAKLASLTVMRVFACLLAGIGVMNGVVLIRGWIRHRRFFWTLRASDTLGGWRVLLGLLIAGAAMMALGPATDADSLDYHMGVPVSLLVTGGMPVAPEWFHSRIAGSNEVLNALGLAAGGEALGALLQFTGLVAIAGLLLFAESAGGVHAESSITRPRIVAAVAALSAPVLVGLVSQKPQLLPIAMTSLGLALVVFPSRRELAPRPSLQGHALVCLLVMSASQAKFTYMLGGGVVGLLSLMVMARRGMLWPALGIGLIAAAVVLVPPLVWKAHFFHDGLINSLFRPVPGHWPGTDAFERYLRHFRDSTVSFPLSLVVPSGPTTVSTVIGPAGALLLLAFRPGKDGWCWISLAAATFVLAASVVLGPATSRSYLEPYFWLLMAFACQPDLTVLDRARWITWAVILQAIFTAGLFWYGAAILSPGALTARWRATVMDRSANGYGVMKWAGSVLPRDAVLLSAHRSVALAPRDVVSLDWTSYAKVGTPEARTYLTRIRDRGVTHMLVLGSRPDFLGLEGCVGDLVAGPGDFGVAVRNPFSRSGPFHARIFTFKSELLPSCVTPPK